MTTTVQIGRYLTQLREKAGLKQNELAQKITWSPSVLSRVESGERLISQEELEAILKAIDTEEALQFAKAKGRVWVNSPEPPLGHPDQHILWEAELALSSISELLKNPNIKNVFVKRLDEYQAELKNAARLVWGKEYRIAFIGSIGVGKTEAICRATGLEVREEPRVETVLATGAGGTTICEVHLSQGPHYGIRVEPVSDGELHREVNEFAQDLIRTLPGAKDNVKGDRENLATSKEIDRAIRNMTSLRSSSQRRDDGTRQTVDYAKNLAQEFADQNRDTNTLAIEILSRIKPHERTRRELWYPELSNKPPKLWLQEIFLDVNLGRHSEFSIPQRIEVIVPEPILEEESLSVRIVDTKGVDDTAEREDLEFHFSEANTVIVLCSGFNDAPSNSAQQLLDRATQGQFPDLSTKAAILVLPRLGEALAMKTDEGDAAQDTEDGYELKREQVAMKLESWNFNVADVEFFNAREDGVEKLNGFLLKLVGGLREQHRKRLSRITIEANGLVDNFEKEQASEVLEEAGRRLTTWVNNNQQVWSTTFPMETSLLNAIDNAHPSSVWASIRREGEWGRLDYPHQLGHGSRVKVSSITQRKQQDFKAVTDNLLNDPELEEAHGLVQQAQRIFEEGIETLLRKSRQMGVTFHTSDMKPDSKVWSDCEYERGLGPGLSWSCP